MSNLTRMKDTFLLYMRLNLQYTKQQNYSVLSRSLPLFDTFRREVLRCCHTRDFTIYVCYNFSGSLETSVHGLPMLHFLVMLNCYTLS